MQTVQAGLLDTKSHEDDEPAAGPRSLRQAPQREFVPILEGTRGGDRPGQDEVLARFLR